MKGPWVDLGDLSGTVAVVTGANSGLGLAVTERLTGAGATVVLACRNQTRAERARAGLAHPDRAVVEQLDVSEPSSIEAFAARFGSMTDRLDLLINNAGVMMTPAALTPGGIESQWATNTLGPFALTGLLLDHLAAAPGSRVVSVASLAATGGSLVAHDPTSLDGYRRFGAYAASKLGNLVFTVELGRRLARAGLDVTATAGHPGLARTNLALGIGVPGVDRAARLLVGPLTQPALAGAEPILAAAIDPTAGNGTYFGPAGWRGYRGRPVEVTPPAAALDPATGEGFWARSVELTGVDYLTD